MPEHIQAFISPGIQACHFEVGKDIADKFAPFANKYRVLKPIIPPPPDGPQVDTWEDKDQWRVDLYKAIREHLVQSGLRGENIGWSERCTYCFKAITDLRTLPEHSRYEYQYYSFRRDKSDPLEAQMGVIMMR